jgi:hypothetical protein
MKLKGSTLPQRHVFYANSTSVIPNIAARGAKNPLAARRDEDELGELDKLAGGVVAEPGADGDVVGDDIPNANTVAPSPPITGPLSESYRSLREKMSAFSWKPEEPREPSTHSTLVLAEGLCGGQECIIGFSCRA